MAWDVSFINGINISGGGNVLLNQLIQDMVNQTNFIEDLSGLKDLALLTSTRAIGQDDTFTALSGPVELDGIAENGLKTEAIRSKTPNKGFKIKEYGNKLTTSFLMRQRIEKTQDLNGADNSVLKGWSDFLDNGKFLFDWGIYNMAIDVINLLYKGFSITTQNGPGSATPKGQAMFSATQSVRGWAIIYRNTLTTANQAFAAASLQDALDTHKTQLRLDNGYRVKQPKWAYQLWSWRYGIVWMRKVLNTAGSLSDVYSGGYGAGTNNNANQRNQFDFDGNKIELKEFELMGDTDKFGNTIGSDTSWYVVNADTVQNIKWFRLISLYDPQVKTYVNNDTDGYVTDIRLWYAVDHYGVEAGIVGSLGTV